MIPELRSPGEGNGNSFQYSCLENPIDKGAWQAIVHGVARVRHDLATKPPLFNDREKATFLCDRNILYLIGMQHMYIFVYSLNVRRVHLNLSIIPPFPLGASLVAQLVKNLPAIQETPV